MEHDGRDTVRLESLATRWAVGAFVAAGLVTLIAMAGRRLPLAGAGSLGNIAAWATAGFAALAYASAFLLGARRGYDAWRRRLPLAKRITDLVATTAAMGMLSYLVVLAVAGLFQLGFIGLTIDPWGGAALAGAAVAVFAYAAVLAGAAVTAEGLAAVATLVLFTGTMASMLSAPDQSWWQLHFSQLGNSDAVSGYRFNLALIVTGAVVTALANYVGHDIDRGLTARRIDPTRRVRLFSWLFAGIGLCLMVAGFVPDAVNIVVHVGAASGMVVVFAVFVLCALRLLPGLPKEVSGFSLLVIAGIVVAALLWVPIGYYNLTGMEFIAAGLLFAWLLVFVRAIGAYATGRRR